MEYPLSIVPEESELSLESDEEAEVKTDPFASSIPTWTTRYHCLQAYCCFVLSYLTTLKFCLTVGKYGFVIFIPYWFYTIFYGIASVLVEIHVGRYIIGNVSRAWDMCPLSKGILWCLFGTTYFTIVHDYLSNSYLLKYFFWSFRSKLPWENCGLWSNANCYQMGKKATAMSKCIKEHSEAYCKKLKWETSGEQFWRYRVIATTDLTDISWSLCGLAVSVFFSFAINYKGIRSIEKLFPLFVYPTLGLWLLLSCVTFLVPKALHGFSILWELQWGHLVYMDIWLEGFSDIVYFLGLGKITLSFISSHGRFDDNILLDVLIASFGSLFVCALIITPILSIITSIRKEEGFMDTNEYFKSIDNIFVFLSEALTYYPYPKPLWSVLTYLNWFLMSTSAQALSVLGVIEAVEGLLSFRTNLYFWISIMFAVVSFCSGALFIFFPVLFEVNLGPPTTTILLLSTVTWQHSYGIWRFNKDYYFMMGRPLPLFMKACWFSVFIMPATVLFLDLYKGLPNGPLPGMIYIYTAIPLSVYLMSMCVQLLKFHKDKRPLVEVFKANQDWGPQNPNLKKSRIVFDSTTASKELLYRQELCNRPFKKPPEFSEQNIVQLN